MFVGKREPSLQVWCDISTKINDLERGICNEMCNFPFHLLESLLGRF